MEAGDVLYFWGEEQLLIVVMANDKGLKYYDAKSPEFTDEGNIITRFATYEELNEVCSYMGNVGDFVQVRWS